MNCNSLFQAMYVKFIGNLFLQMLKGIIIPLVIPSLIVAVGSLDLSLSGKIGGRAIAYYMITTVMAVILGIILVTRSVLYVTVQTKKNSEMPIIKLI